MTLADDLQKIQGEIDEFLGLCTGVIESALLDFPNFNQVHEDPSGTMKWIVFFQQKRSEVANWHTRLSQWKLRLLGMTRQIEKSSVAHVDKKPYVAAFQVKISDMIERERIFKDRELSLAGAISSLVSIQSAYTRRLIGG